MPNEKMENLLNLALAATQEEREKSLELDIGYDSAEQTWEVIVKFANSPYSTHFISLATVSRFWKFF